VIRLEHRKRRDRRVSPPVSRSVNVGGSVEITATPPGDVGGSRLTFHVHAVDGSGQVVAAGEIDRAIVDRQRFLASVSAADASH
jgi:predicted thioesterase